MIVECPHCESRNRIPASRISSRARCGRCRSQLAPMGWAVALRSFNDFEELVRDAPLPVVVDFRAPWCAPCLAMEPEVQALARSRVGRAVVAKVDTQAFPEVAARQFHPRHSHPDHVSRGLESRRVTGAMPADQIARALAL